MRILRLTPVLLWAALGTACLKLKPVVDPVRDFVLDAPAPEAPLPPVRPTPVVVALLPVTLPAYLNTPWMAVRDGRNEIVYSRMSRWGERPEQGVRRFLADQLAHRLKPDRIVTGAWHPATVDLEVEVRLSRCDLHADGRVRVEGQWTIRQAGKVEGLQSGQHSVASTGPKPREDPAGAVAGLSGALADLAGALAAAVRDAER